MLREADDEPDVACDDDGAGADKSRWKAIALRASKGPSPDWRDCGVVARRRPPIRPLVSDSISGQPYISRFSAGVSFSSRLSLLDGVTEEKENPDDLGVQYNPLEIVRPPATRRGDSDHPWQNRHKREGRGWGIQSGKEGEKDCGVPRAI
jgi:hypothetical protein